MVIIDAAIAQQSRLQRRVRELQAVRIVRSLRISIDIYYDQSLRLIIQRLFALFGLVG